MAKGQAGNKVRTITCAGCGITVTRRMPPGRRYCSHHCYATSPKPVRRTGRTLTCEWCGGAFYVAAGRADEARFCELACQIQWQGRNKTIHRCKVCGGEFRWSPSRTASGNYNVTYCSQVCRNADPERRALLLVMNAQQQQLSPNRVERMGYGLLDQLGLPYERQVLFGGKFCVDATIPDARLVVQFDGDYWHDRKGTSIEARIRRRVALDHSQDAYIHACGWRVVRLWGSDLEENPAGCLSHLRALLSLPVEAR